MGTYNHTYKSTYNLLRGLRGLISTVVIRVIRVGLVAHGQWSEPTLFQPEAPEASPSIPA